MTKTLAGAGWGALAGLAALGLIVGCAPAGGGDPVQGLVLVSVDAIRAERLGLYGGPVPTPGLARLAARGVVFDDAATVTPMARPAATTLLTGLAPDVSGVRNDVYDRIAASVPTLPRLFAEAGRATVGLVGTRLVSYGSGLADDFELFDGPEKLLRGAERYVPEPQDEGLPERFAEAVAGLDPERPFFAWVHLATLHGTATRVESLDESLAAYDAQLGEVDARVGELLEALASAGRLERTAIVLVGTHGVYLGEDGARGSAYWLGDENLRVPLIVAAPADREGFEAGTRSNARVWLPDVAASLAALGGVELADEAEGRDLGRDRGALAERVRRAWTWAPDDEMAWPTLTAVDDGSGWRSFRWTELEGEAGDGALALARERPATPRERVIPDELKAAIEAAGLVEDWEESAPPEPETAARNDLLTRIQVIRHPYLPGAENHEQRRNKRLVTRELIMDEELIRHLGVLEPGLYAAAMGATVALPYRVRIGLQNFPTRPEVLHWAGHALFLDGKADQGRLLVEAALATSGPEPDLLYDLACTLALDGETERALDTLEQAIQAGFRLWGHIEGDHDLADLRSHPRYAAILGRYGQ